jgi:hypothetical membrane protein
MTRSTAWFGVVGPCGFIAAWVIGAAVTDREYSSVDDAISQLAAVGADTRPVMTAGMVVFGVAVALYAASLRATWRSPAWIAALTTGVATLFVAALPLDHSDLVDRLHGLAAAVGYVSLAALPLIAARPLLAAGERMLAVAGIVLGAISGIALALSLFADANGLFQRIGLTATDAWIVASVPVVRRMR